MAPASPSHAELARRSFERILLIKPSSLGDVIHTLPVLHRLRDRYPNAKIHWLIASSLAPLLESHPQLDELIPFDRRRFGRLLRSGTATREFLRFVRDLRSRRYDLVIDLQGLFRSGFLARVTGAEVRLGFRNAREGASMFYTHRVEVDDPDAHAVDRNLEFGKLLGFGDASVRFNLPLTASDQSDVSRLLGELGLVGGEQLVAIVPGARWETKVWLPERFTNTINELHRLENVRCLLLGHQQEVSLCCRIAEACKTPPLNLAGRTTLRQLAAILAVADVVLCHDSAAAHLAVAFERPLVCLTGPTNPHQTGPYGRLGDAVRLDLDCSPCYLRRLSQCKHQHRCMEELDVPTVVSAVERALLERVVVSE